MVTKKSEGTRAMSARRAAAFTLLEGERSPTTRRLSRTALSSSILSRAGLEEWSLGLSRAATIRIVMSSDPHPIPAQKSCLLSTDGQTSPAHYADSVQLFATCKLASSSAVHIHIDTHVLCLCVREREEGAFTTQGGPSHCVTRIVTRIRVDLFSLSRKFILTLDATEM